MLILSQVKILEAEFLVRIKLARNEYGIFTRILTDLLSCLSTLRIGRNIINRKITITN